MCVMSIDPRDQDILTLRDRMIERNPGLRESLQRFLRDWEKYLDTMEGTPTPSTPHTSPRQREHRRGIFLS